MRVDVYVIVRDSDPTVGRDYSVTLMFRVARFVSAEVW